jgi:hypothetical protein
MRQLAIFRTARDARREFDGIFLLLPSPSKLTPRSSSDQRSRAGSEARHHGASIAHLARGDFAVGCGMAMERQRVS